MTVPTRMLGAPETQGANEPRPHRMGLAQRRAIHAGACLVLPPSATSEALVGTVRGLVAAAFDGQVEHAHHGRDDAAFFQALTRARAALDADAGATRIGRALLAELGVTGPGFLVDRIRLRGVAPGGHRALGTRDAYALHRDTWYANPRAQINLWVPLRAVGRLDGLSLFPDLLRWPLRNDSERFDHGVFQAQGGFQSGVPRSPAAYPRLLGVPPRPAWVPALPRAGRLLFAGAQLHGPTPHDESETRFSVDLRFVALSDMRLRRGAPQVDDRSRGDASNAYVAASWDLEVAG
ncbi:MAG: hypothetical protein R3B40_04505 [Polyangiales bacterium]|nr:hypothetical protein [Myxococcales bacterium]MCB9662175.1 hypothetical protein [Sandaracinaceae bacterium]